MKQKILLKTMLLLCALVAGTSMSWATENDTHDFAQSLSQLLNNNASIASINIAEQSYPVKKVTVSYRYNKTITNAVTVSVSVGGEDWGSQYVVGTGSDYTTMDFTGDATTGAIVISFTNNTGTGTGHGTFYVNNIQLVEGASADPSKVATPTITIPDGAFVSTKDVTIECTTPDAAIQYSTDGGSNWTNYSASFTISATTTVQAKATKGGMDDSNVAEATFTKETVLEGLAELTSQDNTSDATYYVNLTAAQVTWANGAIGYMEDANAGVYLYNVSPTANLVYNGIFRVTYQVYNSMPEIKSITAVEGNSAAGSAKAATVMTASDLDAAFDANLGRQIQINGFTVPSPKKLTENISFYESSPYTSVTTGTTYTLVGYPFYAKVSNTVTKQFRIISAEEVVKSDNSITGVNDSYTLDIAGVGVVELDLSTVAAAHGTLQSEIQSSTVNPSDYDWTSNVLTVSTNGVIVIRYYVDADAEYNGVEKIVTVTVEDDPVIAYDGATGSTPYGTPYVVDADLIDGGDITLVSSSNTAVATVAGLTINPVAVGTTTITINTAATDIWHAGTATFTLNVTQPAGKTTAAPGETTVFEETFAGCDGTGGNDDQWSGTIASSTLNADNSGWEFSNGSGADKCAKFGAGSKKGSATTPALGTTGTLELSFKAAAWDGSSEGTTLNLSVSAGSISAASVTLTKAEFKTFTATITNATAETKITFEAKNTSSNRFFLDDIVVTKAAEPISVTLNGSGYATFCSEYPLDFSDYATADYSAWRISNISPSNEITFVQVTGTVKGGTGLFLKGEAGETITLTSTDSDSELMGNMLIGTLAPTIVTAGQYYGLSGANFVKVNAGTIKKGKAVLPAGAVTEGGGVKDFTFIFDDEATGIRTIETVSAEEAAQIFDLSGRRLNKIQKGVNIVNGRKVLY